MDTSRMKRTRTFAALAVAAVLPLAACGGSDGDGGDETTTTASESSETSSDTGSATTEPSDSETSESSGSETSSAGAEEGKVTSDQAGVTFDVPEGWKVVDPKEALSGGGKAPKELEEMAKTQGMSVDQFLQQIAQQTDVIVFGQEKGNFRSNVNVVASPATLTEAQLKSQLETIKAKVKKTEEVDSPLGKVLDATYVLPMGGQQVQGRMIVAPTDKGAAIITVSTGDAKESDKIAKVIIPSLGKA